MHLGEADAGVEAAQERAYAGNSGHLVRIGLLLSRLLRLCGTLSLHAMAQTEDSQKPCQTKVGGRQAIPFSQYSDSILG